MIEEYLDDFNSLNKLQHSVGGEYLSLCHWLYDERQKGDSIFPALFIPPGVHFSFSFSFFLLSNWASKNHLDVLWEDMLQVFFKMVKTLEEEGMEMMVKGEKVKNLF